MADIYLIKYSVKGIKAIDQLVSLYSGGDVSCLSALFQHANGDDCSYRAYALEKCGRPTWYKRHRC